MHGWGGKSLHFIYTKYSVCIYICVYMPVYEMYACICTGKFGIYYNLYAIATL